METYYGHSRGQSYRFGSSHRTSQIQELQLFLENSADFFRQLSVRRRLEIVGSLDEFSVGVGAMGGFLGGALRGSCVLVHAGDATVVTCILWGQEVEARCVSKDHGIEHSA